MVAALNAFMKISKAEGESLQGLPAGQTARGKGNVGDGKEGRYFGWIAIQNWEWEVEAESSWTKGGGAAVGKPVPAKMSWEHYWDTSSSVLLQYICRGDSFDEIELHMCKSTGKGTPEPYWIAKMKGAFITKVNQSANEEGGVTQKVEMVFKEINTLYKIQGKNKSNPGLLEDANNTTWIIDEGKVPD